MTPTTKTPEPAVSGDALMEAFRALRADDHVQKMPVGSSARKAAIRRVLRPIAEAYDVGHEDLAMALANEMSR